MRNPRGWEEDPHLQGDRAAKQNESNDQDQVRLEERDTDSRIELLHLFIAFAQKKTNGIAYPQVLFFCMASSRSFRFYELVCFRGPLCLLFLLALLANERGLHHSILARVFWFSRGVGGGSACRRRV